MIPWSHLWPLWGSRDSVSKDDLNSFFPPLPPTRCLGPCPFAKIFLPASREPSFILLFVYTLGLSYKRHCVVFKLVCLIDFAEHHILKGKIHFPANNSNLSFFMAEEYSTVCNTICVSSAQLSMDIWAASQVMSCAVISMVCVDPWSVMSLSLLGRNSSGRGEGKSFCCHKPRLSLNYTAGPRAAGAPTLPPM